MARWLLKEDPESYRFELLVRDGSTEWTGVHNALALRHLKAMRPGDEGIFYHSGEERSAVGILRIAGDPHPDPADDRGSWSVRVEPVRPLARPVPLSELKADESLGGFVLLRMGRLSVMPVTDAEWSRVLAHAATPAARPVRSSGRAPGRATGGRRGAAAARRTRRPTRSTSAARRGRATGRSRGTGG